MVARAYFSASMIRFSKKGVDVFAAVGNQLLFREDGGVQMAGDWIRGVVTVDKNDKKNIKLPVSFTGIPLIFIQRQAKGKPPSVSSSTTPDDNWVWQWKLNGNKITIYNEGKKSDFSYAILDARIN